MSEPKRYNFSATIVHHIGGEKTAALKYHTEPDGLFVSYEDYARIKAEVRLLKEERCFLNQRLDHFVKQTVENREKVERLTNQNALATPRHLIASQDIKTLREQIEELKLENSQYEEHHKYGQNVITSLREEVERLTKAGDAMARVVSSFGFDEAPIAWSRAKEGKPRD
jgi:chromosome segregation ATPase